MKIPEPLFRIINVIVSLLLASPLHGLLSGSLMVLFFRGRKTGRPRRTPVRYMTLDGEIRCFTHKSTNWWKNVRHQGEVEALIAGDKSRYRASLTTDDPEPIRAALLHYLARFPQDAVYHEIGRNADGELNRDDLERALPAVVMVALARVE